MTEKTSDKLGILTATLVAAGFCALFFLERRKPLRRSVEPKWRRTARNLAVAALSTISLQTTERPVTTKLTAAVDAKRLGLLKVRKLPQSIERLAGLLLLDYTLYVWHVLTHKVPLLWRFHKVHHADLDLDASTGIRFHFGEMLISVLFRAAQVRLLGISARTLRLWNVGLLLEVMFHHSNIRLPDRVERLLSRIIITPRLHGIHHSVLGHEMDSNWSSGLTAWDFLHRTFRDDVPQREIVIGIPEVRSPEMATLRKVLALPFRGKDDSSATTGSSECRDGT